MLRKVKPHRPSCTLFATTHRGVDTYAFFPCSHRHAAAQCLVLLRHVTSLHPQRTFAHRHVSTHASPAPAAAIGTLLRNILLRNAGCAPGCPPVRVLNNLDWFGTMGFLTFLREIGKFARVGTMLAKDSVGARVGTRRACISGWFGLRVGRWAAEHSRMCAWAGRTGTRWVADIRTECSCG